MAGEVLRRRGSEARHGASARVVLVGAAVAALVVGLSPAPRRAAAAGTPFWERLAEPPRVRCDRLVAEAEAVLAGGDPASSLPARLTRAQALVGQALEAVPDDFRALMLLAELAARAERPAALVAALDRACPRAPRGTLAAACWFRLGVERSRLGQLEGALQAYERLIALGEADGAAYANAGEILMVMGRLEEAEARYRDAVNRDAPTSTSARRENVHGLTLSTYGLAVVLDRAGRPGPAREMMGRALALDPRLTKLRAAEQPGGDVFFLPDGDVFYYLGLASEVAGRVDDAEAAFQEFLARLPKSRWAPTARAHIDALEARSRVARAPQAPRPAGLRVVAAGTVMASGPIPAPLVDAAWRAHPPRVDACFDDAVTRGVLAPRESFRVGLEVTIDGRGAVSAASVKAPALDPLLARCVEAAVKVGLRLSRPRKAAPTRARVELLIAVGAAPEGREGGSSFRGTGRGIGISCAR